MKKVLLGLLMLLVSAFADNSFSTIEDIKEKDFLFKEGANFVYTKNNVCWVENKTTRRYTLLYNCSIVKNNKKLKNIFDNLSKPLKKKSSNIVSGKIHYTSIDNIDYNRFTISSKFGAKYRVFISEDLKNVFIFNKISKSNENLFSIIPFGNFDINNIKIDNSYLGKKLYFSDKQIFKNRLFFISKDKKFSIVIDKRNKLFQGEQYDMQKKVISEVAYINSILQSKTAKVLFSEYDKFAYREGDTCWVKNKTKRQMNFVDCSILEKRAKEERHPMQPGMPSFAFRGLFE